MGDSSAEQTTETPDTIPALPSLKPSRYTIISGSSSTNTDSQSSVPSSASCPSGETGSLTSPLSSAGVPVSGSLTSSTHIIDILIGTL